MNKYLKPWPLALDGRRTAPFKFVPPLCNLVFAYGIDIGIDSYEEALYIKKDYRHFDLYSVSALYLPRPLLSDPDRLLLKLGGLQLLSGHVIRKDRTGAKNDELVQEMFELLIEARLPYEFPIYFIKNGSLTEKHFESSLLKVDRPNIGKALV
tara:strand:- start:335 stop:793 length:459 start_codon:yes stop_codon:yes gene_type:complete